MEEEKDPLEKAEELIALGEAETDNLVAVGHFEKAQEIINSVKEKSGRKYHIQSRLYKAKKWYGEQRKNLKKAIKAEPKNEDYKRELEELENSEEMKNYKSVMKALRQNEMGNKDGVCSEGCCECCVYGTCGLAECLDGCG